MTLIASLQTQNMSKANSSFQHAAPAVPESKKPVFPYPMYVLPVQQRDDRTPKQRCWDNETARIGETLSDLDRRAIDLKCSQR
ncbi:hypothetical protein [Sphingomonas faeni]|nr:hypothetical protein [Sphingomonas faeni]